MRWLSSPGAPHVPVERTEGVTPGKGPRAGQRWPPGAGRMAEAGQGSRVVTEAGSGVWHIPKVKAGRQGMAWAGSRRRLPASRPSSPLLRPSDRFAGLWNLRPSSGAASLRHGDRAGAKQKARHPHGSSGPYPRPRDEPT